MGGLVMKRLFSVILGLVMLLSAAAVYGEDGKVISLQQEAEQQLQKELGAFEITANQRELARENEAGYPMLDAGRGNPNWINTQARYAFTRFCDFATRECELDMSNGYMAGHAKAEGIGERFAAALDPENDTDMFLGAAVDHCVNTLGIDRDSLLKALPAAGRFRRGMTVPGSSGP